MKYVESDGTNTHSVGYEYDTINNLTALVETINSTVHTTSYTYDSDNRISSVTNDDTTKSYTYDAYSRVSEQTIANDGGEILSIAYAYRNPSDTTTTGQVSSLIIDAGSFDVTYAYTYDDNGNILTVSDGTNTTSYVYDSAGQLLRENNQAANKTWVWEYDNAGNIQSRMEYGYTIAETLGDPIDTIQYKYEDEDQWGDLLTEYDGRSISYDEIGNPESDGVWTYTWIHGRELASMTDGTTTWTYTYDANGMRTERSNGTTTYEYVYNGSQLVQMTVGSDTLYFTSDTVTYNGTVYYYVKNLQGDVAAIINSSGAPAVLYAYDAWGNILNIDGTMADTLGVLNPIRYRSYVYDQESGLYYLQSRYYDPEMGRFLNADSLATTGQGVLGNNMFSYCNNNPIRYTDTMGQMAEIAGEEGDEDFRPVGAGIQVEFDIGCVTVGFEIIVYWDVEECTDGNAILAVYLYGGGALNGYDDNLGSIIATVSENISLLTSGTEAGINALVDIIKGKYSVSVSGLFLLGNDEFTSVDSYTGLFVTFSGSVKHIKGGVAVSGNCIAFSLGTTSSASPSWGVSSTYYTLRGYMPIAYATTSICHTCA